MRYFFLLLLSIFFCPALHATIPWPMEPFDSAQPIGNSWGEYQNYGTAYYMHPGIDIMRPAGTPVYAVKAGWVKAVLTTSAQYHWRVAIGDSASAAECDGWLYAHLVQATIAVSEGQHVDSGQYLGDLIYWPVSGFHHLHFAKIRHSGLTWTSDWWFVGNPLDELVNIDDFDEPYFLEITPGSMFRFCQNNSSNFFAVGQALSGDVDIIVQAHDKIGHPFWVLTPYAIGYEIYSDSLLFGPFTSFVFTGELLWNQSHHVVYKRSGPCMSEGNYDYREFYEIITNHDEDTLITLSDAGGKWATGQVPNGLYTIKVWAADRFGNTVVESMIVVTENYYQVSGTVDYSDGNPFLAGTAVAIPFTGAGADTDSLGYFDFGSQPAGRYQITAAREGYETFAHIRDIFSQQNLLITLEPAPFVDGDVDHDGMVNIADVVYLIGFVFGGGPYPVPWAAAVNIDPNPLVNITDVVYLINYIFGGGPPPGGGKQ